MRIVTADEIVDHDGSGDALTQHLRVVSDFYRYGKRKEED